MLNNYSICKPKGAFLQTAEKKPLYFDVARLLALFAEELSLKTDTHALPLPVINVPIHPSCSFKKPKVSFISGQILTAALVSALKVLPQKDVISPFSRESMTFKKEVSFPKSGFLSYLE